MMGRWRGFPACTATGDSIYPFAIFVCELVLDGTCVPIPPVPWGIEWGTFQPFGFRHFPHLKGKALKGRVAQRESTTLTS
jgi:hypothetical protein